MATLTETYEGLKTRAALNAQENGGKCKDGKLMADKAAAKNEIRKEARKRNSAGGWKYEAKVPDQNAPNGVRTIQKTAPSKRSLQEAYVRSLPDAAQEQAAKRLGLA